MKEKRWILKKNDSKIAQKLAKELGVNEIIAKLLVLRGVTSFEDAKRFFRPKLNHLHDPFLMKNMSEAVKRLELAINQKQNILVYGDYDVDGTTSVAMVYSFLKKHTRRVSYYIPCRYNEGYGISLQAIDHAKKTNISLIIALDCGIRAVKQVNYATKNAIDVIICDHHNPSKVIPDAIAILNPKQSNCNYPYKELSGCGVGFKLMQAYCIKNSIPFHEIIEYLDLVAVSIAADIVPMNGENRVLAFYGLKQINSKPRVGLKALVDISFIDKELSISDISFGIAPRINAAGRMEHAKKAVEILIEQDYEQAYSIAEELEKNNKERKNLEKSITQDATQMVDKTRRSIVVFSEGWHKGVVGIVASRLVEMFYKPTIVLVEHDGIYTGSARSVRDFDVYEAISKCSHLCEKFGGHKYAAGLSIKKQNIQSFIEGFETAVCEAINADQLLPSIEADLQIEINAIDWKLFRIIKQFAPFGPLNPSPVFISNRLIDNGYSKKVGSDKSHLRISLKTNYGIMPAIGFSMANLFEKVQNGQEFNICYSIAENAWKGKKSLQVILRDIKTP